VPPIAVVRVGHIKASLTPMSGVLASLGELSLLLFVMLDDLEFLIGKRHMRLLLLSRELLLHGLIQ
jgi:hypothetical protein